MYSLPIEEYYKDGEAINNTLSNCRPKMVLKDEHPDIEDVRTKLEQISEKGIEITITFKPELQNRYSPKTLTDIVKNILQEYRKRNKFSCVMVGEFSRVGIYHLHGSILAPARMINSMRRKMPRELGRTELKAIRYVESWVKYCLKDEETNEEKELTEDELIYMV